MRVTYDRSADAAYIYLVDIIEAGEVARTYLCDPIEIKGQINLDFNSEGRLLGIEVLGASKKLPANLIRDASTK